MDSGKAVESEFESHHKGLGVIVHLLSEDDVADEFPISATKVRKLLSCSMPAMSPARASGLIDCPQASSFGV